jgi:hypothetical protein
LLFPLSCIAVIVKPFFPFGTSIYIWIILHTCVLFKMAIKHEFISSFYFLCFSCVSNLFGNIGVDTFNLKYFRGYIRTWLPFGELVTCTWSYVNTGLLRSCRFNYSPISRLALLLYFTSTLKYLQ